MIFIEFVAFYAAIIATCAAGISTWQVLRSRRRLKIHARPNMVALNEDGKRDGKYITVTAINIGPTPLTISNLLWEIYAHPHLRLGERREQGGISRQPDLPKVIGPGEEWTGLIIQDGEFDAQIQKGHLWVTVHSSGAEGRCRVQVK